MSPEEKVLLERTLKLSEENNKILQKIERKAKWAFFWGLFKIAVVVVPLVAGFLYLQPFLEPALENLNKLNELISN